MNITPDYATADTRQVAAVWCVDTMTVHASLGAVDVLSATDRILRPTRICRLSDAMLAATAAADGEPVHWVEYRAVSLGPFATELSEDSVLWRMAPSPQHGFDVLASTFDLNRLQQFLLAQAWNQQVPVIERRVWTYLSAPGPWTRTTPPDRVLRRLR